MGDPNSGDLRAELERVRKERDDYRAIAADLLKRQFDVDLDEWEAALRDYQKNGGIPFSDIQEMLETEFGIKL
jgi:hypothetical protein